MKEIKNINHPFVEFSIHSHILRKELSYIISERKKGDDGFRKLVRHLIFIRVALSTPKNSEELTFSPSKCQFSPRKLRRWSIRNRYLSVSVPPFPSPCSYPCFFLFFSRNARSIHDPTWLLLLLCKEGVSSNPLSRLFLPHTIYSWLSNPSSATAKATLLNYVWSTVKVRLFLVAVSRKDGGRISGYRERQSGESVIR